MKLLFYIGELLYKTNFPLYYIFYSFYKKIIDRAEMQVIKKIVSPGSIILDIGANIGFYSRYISKLTGPGGFVHCFEPDITNFNHLKKVTSKLKNIKVNHMAVSDSEKALKLYKSHRLNVDHRTYPVSRFDFCYDVPSTSIDKYVNKEFKVDFIKMDIQGAEYAALKGMKETLKANPEIIVIMEIFPKALEESGTSVEAVFELIHSLNLNIYNFNFKKIEFNDLKKYHNYSQDQFENIIIARRLPTSLF